MKLSHNLDVEQRTSENTIFRQTPGRRLLEVLQPLDFLNISLGWTRLD